ncbi:unnamed protein product [Vitrella brassicaformis CCMP3155]|uniref:Uncharacterized protein n=1 Tax=Vitrella brassicaformis (strain CCMP3155) TaxID=1169540 RepID=A0A0G4ECZ1_VITBC|nr:unnamed protein product [Vitrella brassicaformis CCMP3155]|eukprot:CEL93427.1 unnamed protein product [Vitrella brassicaformis CCMP3155]
MLGRRRSMMMPPTVAKLHHYRSALGAVDNNSKKTDFTDLFEAPPVTDSQALKYGRALQEAVTLTKRAMGRSGMG